MGNLAKAGVNLPGIISWSGACRRNQLQSTKTQVSQTKARSAAQDKQAADQDHACLAMCQQGQ